jgi:hypothetical protein
LHLPLTTAKSVFYVGCKDGGLGLMEFGLQMPILKLSLYRRLRLSEDRVTLAVMSDDIWVKDFEVVSAMITEQTGRAVPVDKVQDQATIASQRITKLSDTVQGRGCLTYVGNLGNFWLRGRSPGWMGRRFILSMKLRYNLIVTREYANRGRILEDSQSTWCRHGCEAIETQPHILQFCPKTKNARIKRHHKVVDLLVTRAANSGWSCETEVTFKKLDGSKLRPDIILRKGNETRVVDVTIAYEHDALALESADRRKRAKYSCLMDALLERYPETSVPLISGFVIGARGIWWNGNDALWAELKGTKSESRTICESVICGSGSMIKLFMDA